MQTFKIKVIIYLIPKCVGVFKFFISKLSLCLCRNFVPLSLILNIFLHDLYYKIVLNIVAESLKINTLKIIVK